MKQLTVSFEGIHDSTGYLFSFAKALSTAVKHSPYSDLTEDIIATSGFAFRMWVNAELCPSATSIWAFSKQKPWVENGGLTCGYIERLWDADELEEARRLEAISLIRQSIDQGIPAIAWDIGLPEWGLIYGYDDEAQRLTALSATSKIVEMDYTQLGKNEIPILNVLTITGRTEKSQADITAGTRTLAKKHLTGGEWCENNKKGLEAYPALISFFEMEETKYATCWEMEYALGTYAALKPYAWRYFEKVGLDELAELYKTVARCWQSAFEIKKGKDLTDSRHRQEIAELLRTAEQCERKAVELM